MHKKLIEIMKALGYPVNDEGMCFGIAAMAMQAILAKDIDTFNNRLIAIQKYHTHELVATLKKIESKRIKKQKLTAEEEKLSDVRAFLEGVVLYFDPYQFPDLFPKEERHVKQDIVSTLSRGLPSALTNAKDLKLHAEEVVNVKKLDSTELMGAYTQEDLTDYFKQLRPKDPGFNPPLAFVLRSSVHSITVAYDNEKKVWQYIDANHLPTKEFKTDAEMASAVLKAFSTKDYAIFRAEVFCKTEQFDNAQKWLQEVISSEDWKKLHINQEKKHALLDPYGGSLLHVASKGNNSDLIKRLIGNSVDINKKLGGIVTALHLGAQEGNVKIVEDLIAAKAEINAIGRHGYTPLLVAIDCGFFNIAKTLIEKKANIHTRNKDGIMPLYMAIKIKNNAIVNLLIESKADINQVRDDGASLYHIAVEQNDAQIINELVELKVDLNHPTKDGATPLFIATERGNLSVLKALIEAKADLDKPKQGITPLRMAAKTGHLASIKMLIESKAAINQTTQVSMKMLRDTAMIFGRDKFVTQLAQNNAIIENFSVLHEAILFGHLDVVRYLVENKADIQQKIGDKISCIELADAMGQKEIKKFLKTASQPLPAPGLMEKFSKLFKRNAQPEKKEKLLTRKNIK